MKTRAKPKTVPTAVAQSEDVAQLPSADSNPPRILVINDKVGDDATIITLAHPRTLKPTNYYMCPRTGVYEIRKSASDLNLKRSILLNSATDHVNGTVPSDGSLENEGETQNSNPLESGYVLEEATTYSVTPIDPLFLLLPALRAASSSKGDSEPGHFRSSDDILEALYEQSKHLSRLSRSPIRPLLNQRLMATCDTVDAGDESMYRLSEQKLLSEIMDKAKRMCESGLPASLEDKFVARPLEIPLYAESGQTTDVPKAATDDSASSVGKSDSQSTVDSNLSADSFDSEGSADTSITVPELGDAKSVVSHAITELQRLRVATNMIMSLYVPENIASRLRERMNSAICGIDFAPLNEHLAFLEKAKADATAARSIGDFTRKRGFDDDEVAGERAEKKRKKAGESRGIRDLKKVNVSGMKKMSDFFKKQPGK